MFMAAFIAQRLKVLRSRFGIAERDREIAQPVDVTGSADGRAFGALQKLVFGPGEQFQKAGFVQTVPGGEVGLGVDFGEFIPRADQLAVIAAENAVADGRAEFLGDAALMLDGQITDAATRIQTVWCNDGAGRTDVDAARAGSSMPLRGQCRAAQLEVRIDFSEKKPGAFVLVDQAGVLADPAQTGIAGQSPLQ